MTTSDPNRRGPLPALTGARFFAAFAVVVYHYGRGALVALVGPLGVCGAAGPTAVSFFYVLSGAVLTWGCTDAGGLPARPNPVFWAQRAARILPAYALALALSVLPFAAAVLKLHAGTSGLVRIVAGFFACTLLVQAFIVPLTAGLNTPGWSISCEAFFYANWPRLAAMFRSDRPSFPWRSAILFAALACVPPLVAITVIHAGVLPKGPFATLLEDVSGAELVIRTVSYFPPLRLPEFALGVAVGHALKWTPARVRSRKVDTLRETLLFSLLFAVAYVFGSGMPARVFGEPLATRICVESGTTALLFGLIVWQLARGDGAFTRLLSDRRLVLLGEASYGLYVLQEPVHVWLTAALKRFAPIAMERWNDTFWAYSLLLIGISLVVHKRWETPMRSLVLRRLSPRVSSVAGTHR